MSSDGRLTTHVLDTSLGKPAAGMRIELKRLEPDGAERLLRIAVTNSDGRVDAPLISGGQMEAGVYELIFEAGDYFREHRHLPAEAIVFDRIPIRFRVATEQSHYHIPLLIAPGGYSTYRGS
ncbi:hydroxyisourate hydrolase [Paenibacillus protaetiae]|uniref:5-hydroxyisourate hydrolase n=1 Tax=Paenibacillus protaetiae TaxID=2509456 RepID=A0A4P6ERN4_9BACL|nr:hydroxyisourate hydrolase [Paenibacillus protaetiae]QAY65720.1 hydroxyisourate hydrolase [Paenibacillus protaetiae]